MPKGTINGLSLKHACTSSREHVLDQLSYAKTLLHRSPLHLDDILAFAMQVMTFGEPLAHTSNYVCSSTEPSQLTLPHRPFIRCSSETDKVIQAVCGLDLR